MLVDLRSPTERSAFYAGRYESIWTEFCAVALKPGETFLDVGANVGFFTTRVAAAHRGTARVVSFEPHPANAARLKHNIALNNLDNVEVVPFGLSNEPGKAKLVMREDFQEGSATGNASIAISEEADAGFDVVEIELTTLDDWMLNKDCNIGLIKVDIEGHEDKFLQGARATLESTRSLVVMEYCGRYYDWRDINSETVLADSTPADYANLRYSSGGFKEFQSFNELDELENFILCPKERLWEIQAIML